MNSEDFGQFDTIDKTYHQFLLEIFQCEREKVAYIAGFFDGEGYVSFRTYWMSGISNINPKPLYQIMETFGGAIYSNTRPPNRTIYNWHILGLANKRFLETILPYCKIKDEQIEIALKLFAFYRSSSIHNPERIRLQQELRELQIAQGRKNKERMVIEG